MFTSGIPVIDLCYFKQNLLVKFLKKSVTFCFYRRIILNYRSITAFMTKQQYNECVNLYADKVFRFIVKNLRHEEDARDIVQSAFEKMWRNRDLVENEKSKSYLFTVAYNQMIDHIRKAKRVSLTEEFGETSKGANYQPAVNVQQTLREALNRLNETQRSLVMLKDYEGYNYDEIGQITGLSESQVKVYLHRARITLRNYLVSRENVI